MLKKTISHTIETSSAKWTPSKVPGVDYLALNADPDDRFGTFILKMAPKTLYPKHRHLGGEEVLMLKGDMTIGGRLMKPGDFLYSPPGSIHEASTANGCMFLTILPKPIEIVPLATGSEGNMEVNIESAPEPVAPSGTGNFGEVDIENFPEPTPGPSETEG